MGTETVDIAEHEFRSMRRWLNQLFPGLTIHIERPTVAFDRPALRLQEVTRLPADRGRGFGVLSEASWQIEYLGEDFWASKRAVTKIQERLLTHLMVPCYLWGWQYPAAELVGVPGGGALLAGDVSVIVTAVNAQDEESLGASSVITVPAGAAVNVVVAPWPRQARVAEEYRVYAGAVGSEQFQASITDLPEGPVPLVYELPTLIPGAAPPDSSVFFYRFMRVDSVQSQVLEHPDADGIFNGVVSLQTSLLSQRLLQQAPAVEEIAIEMEVTA